MIDFRSDTVTKPTHAMRDVMYTAPVGDDVYGDDESVNALESYACERFNVEAALFCSSGTQANLLAIMAHCERGDEYICGQSAHNYKFEGGGAAVLGSVQPQPIENEADGSLCFSKIAAVIKPDDSHFAKTRLLSLENTIAGKVLDIDYLAKAREFVIQHNLALHLDGARAFNAAADLGVDITQITKHFDSVSICLSKGLGAPVGSLLLGSNTLITKARRWRKVLGGGMRQAGSLAAAGKYALENNTQRLVEDHANARYLAKQLSAVAGFNVNMSNTTNMVYATFDESIDINKLSTQLKAHGIIFSPSKQLRLVTHLGVTRADIDTFIAALTSHI